METDELLKSYAALNFMRFTEPPVVFLLYLRCNEQMKWNEIELKWNETTKAVQSLEMPYYNQSVNRSSNQS